MLINNGVVGLVVVIIYVSGTVAEEITPNGGVYVAEENLQELLDTTVFDAIVVSRFIHFMDTYKFNTNRLILMAHDVILLPYNCEPNDVGVVVKWQDKIGACVCLTEWHKREFVKRYPELTNKLKVINNGIATQMFNKTPVNKKRNTFIYSSRPERGLENLLELWPKILNIMPDAKLYICSYEKFPCNEFEVLVSNTIKLIGNSIEHLGALSNKELYELLDECDFFSTLKSDMNSWYNWGYESAYYDEIYNDVFDEVKSFFGVKDLGKWEVKKRKRYDGTEYTSESFYLDVTTMFGTFVSDSLNSNRKYPDADFEMISYYGSLEGYICGVYGGEVRLRDWNYISPDWSKLKRNYNEQFKDNI